jgi:CelD/BcsL family acetyltransferase involved in cellulose biosynthesis
MRFRLYPDWHDLPAGYAALFGRAGADEFCLSQLWFEAFGAAVLGEGERLAIAGVEADPSAGMPLACLVGRHRERDPAFLGARSFSSLSNYYTLRYAPMVEGGDARGALAALVEGLRTRRPRYAVLHFEPLAAEAALSDDLAAALRGAGLITRRYFRFGNWYDDIRGQSFRDYLARRPAALRNTFRRNSVRLAAAGVVRIAIAQDGGALPDALARYERVYAASWKRREPYPAFIRRLAAALADAGALRLGLLYVDQRPIAAQVWVVQRGRAILYKLAHDRAFDALSPGTVLTMRMLERLLDEERVTELDLGAGDDPYKRLWVSRRRERVGLVAFDPRSWRGSLAILRHVVAPSVKRVQSGYFESADAVTLEPDPEGPHWRQPGVEASSCGNDCGDTAARAT